MVIRSYRRFYRSSQLQHKRSLRVRQNYGEFHTVVQQEQAPLHEWEMIPQDEVALITSMPGRLRAVIQARGGNTRY
jgi:hypothetical protein